MHLLRAQIAFAVQRGGDAPALLLQAARELEAVDPARARTTYLEALEAARFADRLARGANLVEVSEAALAGPAPHGPPRPTDLLLQGMATLPSDGHAVAVPILKAALRAFREEAVFHPRSRAGSRSPAAPRGTCGTGELEAARHPRAAARP